MAIVSLLVTLFVIIPILWEVFVIFFIFLIFFVFPFSLLALAIIGIITGKGKMHAGSESSNHHGTYNQTAPEGIDRTPVDEMRERLERQRWIEELRKWENERYQDA